MGNTLTFGFEIDNILSNVINEEKGKIFANFDEASLHKILKYCYSNTAYKCWGRDDCFHCTVTKFVNEEFKIRERIRTQKHSKFFLFY